MNCRFLFRGLRLGVLAFAACSCASLESELAYQSLSSEIDLYKADSAGFALVLEKQHYKNALERWPWIVNGSQLQRRTLILALEPSDEVLAELDRGMGTPTRELEMINQLGKIRLSASKKNSL